MIDATASPAAPLQRGDLRLLDVLAGELAAGTALSAHKIADALREAAAPFFAAVQQMGRDDAHAQRQAVDTLRSGLTSQADVLLALPLWGAPDGMRGLIARTARLQVELGESSRAVEYAYLRELSGLLQLLARLRDRAAALRGEGAFDRAEQVAYRMRDLQLQMLVIVIAPLGLPLVAARLADVRASVDRAEALIARAPDDDETVLDAINMFVALLYDVPGGPKAFALSGMRSKQVIQSFLMNVNQFAWSLMPFVERWDGSWRLRSAQGSVAARGASRCASAFKERFSDKPMKQPSRDRRFQARCVAGWSQIVDGEWVAVKREQLGFLLLIDAVGGGRTLDVDGTGQVVLGEEELAELMAHACRRIEALREVECAQLFCTSSDLAWVDALRATLCKRELAGPLVRLPLWGKRAGDGLHGYQHELLLERCTAYLVNEAGYDRDVVEQVFDDIGDRLARFPLGAGASGAVPTWDDVRGDAGRLAEFAEGLVELIIAFVYSPWAARNLCNDQLTEDRASMDDLLAAPDPFAPLGAAGRLVLSVRSLRGDAAAIERGRKELVLAGGTTLRDEPVLRGVLGRFPFDSVAAPQAASDGVWDGDAWDEDARPDYLAAIDCALDRVRCAALARDADGAGGTAEADIAPDPGQDSAAPGPNGFAATFPESLAAWQAAGNDWRVVGDDTVSGVHAGIVQAAGGYWCADLGSKSGTAVARCAPAGDTVTLFCLAGRAGFGTDKGRALFDRVAQAFRAHGYRVACEDADAVRLCFGDTIYLGQSTEARVAWL